MSERKPIGVTVPYRAVFPKKDYKLPKEWVGLTDEEILAASASATYMDTLDAWVFARALEAKLKEKNT